MCPWRDTRRDIKGSFDCLDAGIILFSIRY